MKKILYILVFITLGCKTTQKESSKNKDGNMDFKTVAKGALYGAGEEGIAQGNLIVKDKSDWDVLVKKMNTTNEISSNFKELPVDFSKEMIICVFDKVRSTGGIDITITKMSVNKKDISITYAIKKPSKNGMSATVMTQPFHIVKTEKREENIVFVNNEEN